MDFMGYGLLVGASIMAIVHFTLFIGLLVTGLAGGGLGYVIIGIINLAITAIYSGATLHIWHELH